MKKIAGLALAVLCGMGSLNAQETTRRVPVEDALSIAPAHDFGNIRQGRPVTFDFPLTNKGTKILQIEKVVASCGCTTPTWSSAPLLPGQITYITVGYNAAAEGSFEKSVTIQYNGNQTRVINIKGFVEKNPGSAPLNSSVALLKQMNP